MLPKKSLKEQRPPDLEVTRETILSSVPSTVEDEDKTGGSDTLAKSNS